MTYAISCVKPGLDLTAHPAAIQDLWDALPSWCWAFERPLTEREERKGIPATWLREKTLADWGELRGIGLNAKQYTRYITIDCDHDDTERWELIGLTPVMIVANQDNGRHHVTYELAVPVSRGPTSRRKPQVLLSLIVRALVRDLNGDPNYSMLTTKNPLHPAFRVILPGGRPYTLKEMVVALDIDGVIDDEAAAFAATPRGRRRGLALAQQDPGSRNTSLFQEIRHWAYDLCRDRWDHWRAGGDAPWREFQAEVLDRLRDRNVGGLPNYELQAMARSVTRFCRLKLRPRAQGDGKHRGVMRLDAARPLSDRQAQGGKYGGAQAKAKNRTSIADAFWRLTQAGVTPTQQAVAQAAGVSLATVKRSWSELRQDHDNGQTYDESLVSNSVPSDRAGRLGGATDLPQGADSKIPIGDRIMHPTAKRVLSWPAQDETPPAQDDGHDWPWHQRPDGSWTRMPESLWIGQIRPPTKPRRRCQKIGWPTTT